MRDVEKKDPTHCERCQNPIGPIWCGDSGEDLCSNCLRFDQVWKVLNDIADRLNGTGTPNQVIGRDIRMPVQVNGFVRDNIRVPFECSDDYVILKAKECEGVFPWINGRTVENVVVVGRKLVNIIAK